MSLVAASPRHPAKRGPAGDGRHGWSAVTMITIYIALLLAIPSSLTISPLGSLGRPALLWGLLLLAWWLVFRLQAQSEDLPSLVQPVRLAIAALVTVALVSFAAAMLRGQPADQISPAITAMIRLASWSGVLLVTMDGIRTVDDASQLVRGLAIAAGILSAFGLAQFLTGSTLLEWYTLLPGVAFEAHNGVGIRGAYTRAAGTSTHPLEYTTILASLLPITLVVAIGKGMRQKGSSLGWSWWVPVGLIALSAMTAVSRSALIGLLVALIVTLPALPRAYRWGVVIGGTGLAFILLAVLPGLLGTVINLFASADDDPSTLSRTAALARAPYFLSSSPFIGNGFGTFLPRYYIFDNQWVSLALELGLLGVACFAAVGLTGIWSALWAVRTATSCDTVVAIGRSAAASIFTIMILFIFFDGLAFPMSAGLFFLAVGLAAAMRNVASNHVAAQSPAQPGLGGISS